MMLQDKLFREMCRMVKADEYEFVVASHKGHEARFVFRDASGCPFSVDMFQVVIWDKWGSVKCETITSLSGLTEYEKSKLPEDFWRAYGEMRQAMKGEKVA